MDDLFAAFESGKRFGANQTVRVGDDSQLHFCANGPRLANRHQHGVAGDAVA
jgi:hypothetical protein